jgi:hypothetical protein
MMFLTVLLSFLGGVVTVVYLEIQGLEALLLPVRNLLSVFSPSG